MSSPVNFDSTLSGSQVLFGFEDHGHHGTTFNPLAYDWPFTSLSIDGSVSHGGDVVDIAFTTGGFTVSGTATYDGFYVVDGQQVFVFSPGSDCSSLTHSFAITASGQSVPCEFSSVKLNTGTADPCFLRGTMIGTARGEVAVESLSVGDDVSVMVDGRAVSRPVTWIGSRTVTLDAATADVDQFPVRIRAGAFREQVPHRDLLVTSEHCVFVDGVLIPARMLVNNRSIVVDRSITSFEFFHVELAQHGILVSEGLETESYLDTGNRDRFGAAAEPVQAAPKSWDADAAAPLAVDRAVVEPVWQRLVARADALGLTVTGWAAATGGPALHLVTDTGMEIEPSLVEGRSYAFVVPGGVGAVRLRSRTARPSESVGRFVDDRRDLGVLVGQISVSEGRRRQSYDTHLTTGRLSGWHGLEAGAGARWTNGNASLRLDPSRTGHRKGSDEGGHHDGRAARGGEDPRFHPCPIRPDLHAIAGVVRC